MKKNMVKLVAVCLPAAMILAGCSTPDATESTAAAAATVSTTVSTIAAETTAAADHTHSAEGVWEWNGTQHWYVCECGETFDMADHTVSENMICNECGLEIWSYDDGRSDVIQYNEHGDIVKTASFDVDGNVMNESVYEYEYDANGNMLANHAYYDGVLRDESFFEKGSDGEFYHAKDIYYHEDGEKQINEYDENGNVIQSILYDVEGKISIDSIYEYALNSDGNTYESKNITDYGDRKMVAEYNEYEEIVYRAFYDPDGNLMSEDKWEYGHDEDGNETWQKHYLDGRLADEIVGYEVAELEDYTIRYPQSMIEYREDGTKFVSDYDTRGELAAETLYNADGSIASMMIYAYEYDADGNRTKMKTYDFDVLVSETEYMIEADTGFSYMYQITEYLNDGTKTVHEYDSNENLVKTTRYDVNGKEIL